MEIEHYKPKILLAEDDEHAAFLMKEDLQLNGFEVSHATDGKQAALLINNARDFDIALLDIEMPEKNGLQVAELITSYHRMLPIVFITARGLAEDRIAGFKAGCDDYIVKPFNIEELILRLEVVMRRNNNNNKNRSQVFELNNVSFDLKQHLICTPTGEISLTSKESSILKVLLSNFDRTLPRNFILENAWGTSNIYTSRGLDVYIHRLRKLLKQAGPFEIENSHGQGFRLRMVEK